MIPSLRQLRLRLTLWYAATSILVTGLLGAALLLISARAVSIELDRSLREAVTAADELAQLNVASGEAPDAAAVTAVRAIATPGRILYLLDTGGLALVPGTNVPRPILEAATEAFRTGQVSVAFETPGGESWRLFGQRILLVDRVFVVIALADAALDRRQFRRIVEMFVAAGFVLVLLATAGGWVLSGVTAAPVERVHEARRRFMAEAAHELRTPLAVLRGQADLALERGRRADADVRSLEAIAAETERMARIVDDLFTLARADAGEWPVRRERVFLDDIASDAVAAARPLAGSRDVHLDLDRFEESPLIGDPDRIRQLAAILIDNAIKYTPAGNVTVQAFRGAGGGATLIVEDTGVGIAVEDRTRVFDRFFRGRGTRDLASGAGLGLPIARWIADVHGATIDVQSGTGGRGTRITVQFPAAGSGVAESPEPGPKGRITSSSGN